MGVVHGSDDDIKIFFGDGTGNFSSGVAYPVRRSPRWLIAECLRSVPFIPIIDGPTSGKIGVRYEYNFSLSDPNKDKMHLRVDWGSGTPGKWYGPFDSGTKVKLNHTWSKKGTYSIKAQTQDSNGHLSEWSYLEITIPRSRATVNSLFQLLFDRFPLLEVFILRAMNLLR